eukprot:TRINITY_DN115380_c0_g1_i1.p1 TRINITY_DN115380_c0_g1~~TRINITY_DN115380_c0_g1_i1.p1  ORF type:complete len:379 (-),score=124.94 TRINITY_DN115380_c0_g1_i1:131-1267(-)
MAPKKKVEEVALPPPEEFLPAGFSLGCEVHWVEDDLPPADNGEQVQTAMKGTLNLVHELAQPGNRIEFVDVQFEAMSEVQKVPFVGVSLQPPRLEALRTLSTGLRLALRGVDVERILDVGTSAGGVSAPGGYSAIADIAEALLRLEELYPDPAQRDIVKDYHVFALEQARSLCLTAGQTAVFHAIMARLLERIRESMLERQPLTSSDCFQEFQQLVVAHATNDPPKRLQIFSTTEARLLVDFAAGTIFKHFLLYQCAVGSPEKVEVRQFVDTVERPRPPPALNGAREVVKPKRQVKTAEGGEADGAAGAADGEAAEGGAGAQDEASGDAKELTEEEEVERQVAERLKETEALLQKRLEEREDAFKAKLAEAPPPGKKK